MEFKFKVTLWQTNSRPSVLMDTHQNNSGKEKILKEVGGRKTKQKKTKKPGSI